MSVLFRTKRACLACCVIEVERFLHYSFAVLYKLCLTVYLILNSTLNSLCRIKVLDLCPCSELVRTFFCKRNVYITSHRALLKLSVADSCILKHHSYLFKESHDLSRRMEIRLSHYLNKRYTATVVIRKAYTLNIIVNQLTRILFKMDTVYTHCLLLTVYRYINMTAEAYGTGHLRYLICFRQVGIEVILSVPLCKA